MTTPSQVFTSGVLEWQYVKVFFPTANVEVGITHKLTGLFVGWTPLGKSGTCDIWDGQMPTHLVCDTAGIVATLRVEAVRIPRR